MYISDHKRFSKGFQIIYDPLSTKSPIQHEKVALAKNKAYLKKINP